MKLVGLSGLILGLQGDGKSITCTFLLPYLVLSVPLSLIVLLVKRWLGRKSILPLGSMLAGGAILALPLHQDISDTWTVLSWKFQARELGLESPNGCLLDQRMRQARRLAERRRVKDVVSAVPIRDGA